MVESICLPEEHFSEYRSRNGRVFQIVSCPVEFGPLLIPTITAAMKAVNGEDLTGVTQVGEITLNNAERRFYEWVNRGDMVRACVYGLEIVGLLVTHRIADRIEYIRLLYTTPDFEGDRVGKGLVDSVRPRSITFRTRRDIPPQRCLAITAGATLVCRSVDFDLWASKWRTKE